MGTEAATAVIYARQSFDRHKDELAVSRQLATCREFAAKQGWTVTAEFTDNDRSATNGKARPEFERLLASRPERIIVWHVDRLVRLTSDLERVIDLGVNVHAVEAGHLDLSHPAGRATAKTVTAWAQYETEQKAVRQKAANDQRAASGLPYRCQRAFGYEADGVTIRKPEAIALRAAADGVIRGRSLSGLAAEMNEKGVTTATGKPWRGTTLKAALLSPRNAGLRRHRGEVVGKASWPAILDADTAASLRAILTDPSRSRKGPARRYLLSGAMTCGKCGGPVVGAYVKGKGETYRCEKIHVTRKVAPVDEWVVAVVVERLSRPDAIDMFARPNSGADVGELRAERGGLRERLDALAEAFAVGDIDRQQLRAGSERLKAQIASVESKLRDAVVDPTLAEVTSHSDVGAAFRALPQEGQRGIIRQLLALELVPVGPGRRKALPTTDDGTPYDPESVALTWRAALRQ